MKRGLSRAKIGALIAACSFMLLTTQQAAASQVECSDEVNQAAAAGLARNPDGPEGGGAETGDETTSGGDPASPCVSSPLGNTDDQPQGGGENTRTVETDTDLYDAREGNRIGGEDVFLRAGQVVTVIGACGDDWCQVAAGKDHPGGWAWGGHFK